MEEKGKQTKHVACALEGTVTESQFDGRLVLCDGGGDVDLVIDTDTQRICLMQGDRRPFLFYGFWAEWQSSAEPN